MTTVLTLALIAAVAGCALWLVVDEARQARDARTERVLRAARFRPDDGFADALASFTQAARLDEEWERAGVDPVVRARMRRSLAQHPSVRSDP